MRHFDVFNGDADGICALRQLRLAEPVDSILVTGLKHEIELLERVDAAEGDVVTVLDVSLDSNRAALERLLARGATVRYFDHHFSGPVPDHPRLQAVLDPTGEACTSELADRYVGGRFRAWAIVGAFGDNLVDAALRLAQPLDFDAIALGRLRRLGEALNYNAYGASLSDVLVSPGELYRIAARHDHPFALIDREPVIERIARRRAMDLVLALGQDAIAGTRAAEVFLLPDAQWSRRVAGTFANRLALAEPHRAHAVLTPRDAESLSVSVRSPPRAAPSASEFCRRFPTGGGRERAAGIQRLERTGLEAFVREFEEAYRQYPPGQAAREATSGHP
jgi:hypothetical protein